MQNILIVDDNNENLTSFRSILERQDFQLLTSDNGKDALKLLAKHDVALVIINEKMPKMSGFEMAELMKRSRKTQSIPVIFMMSSDDKEVILSAYESGAVDCLVRPIAPVVLIAKINVFLKLNKHRQRLEKQLLQILQLKHQNELLLHALGDGVISVDGAGDINFVNPAIESLFSLNANDILGMPLNDLLFQNNNGLKETWQDSAIFKVTSKNERLSQEADFYIKTNSGMLSVQVVASAIPTEADYIGAVITLRVSSSSQSDLNEEIARGNRRQTRKRVGTVLRLFDRSSGMNLGRLANISLDGLKLESRTELPVGRVYPISMILPETLAGSNTLSFDAQAVWCRPGEVTDDFRVGFRIVKIGENDLKVLIQLIEKY